jgi:hypothetical protein
MKALNTLTGSEKARLLHELFPQEMPELLDNIERFCRDFKAEKEFYREKWSSGFMSFDYWQSLSEETAGLVKKHKHSMLKSSRVFSDQLFFSYTSLFVTDRIIKYAEQYSKEEKFKQAVALLFT